MSEPDTILALATLLLACVWPAAFLLSWRDARRCGPDAVQQQQQQPPPPPCPVPPRWSWRRRGLALALVGPAVALSISVAVVLVWPCAIGWWLGRQRTT